MHHDRKHETEGLTESANGGSVLPSANSQNPKSGTIGEISPLHALPKSSPPVFDKSEGKGAGAGVAATLALSNRIAGDPIEARAVIRFLIESEAWAVAERLNLTAEQSRENVAARVLDFIAGIEPKLPAARRGTR